MSATKPATTPMKEHQVPAHDVDDILHGREPHPDIGTALVAIQRDLPVIGRNASNSQYRTPYATNDAIIAAVLPIVTAHGCYVTFELVHEGELGWLVARIVHGATGGKIESRWPMNSLDGGPQQIGSLMTYGRRYLLCAMLSLATGEDDDATAASVPPQEKPQPKPAHSPSPSSQAAPAGPGKPDERPPTQPQMKMAAALFRNLAYSDEERRGALLRLTNQRTGSLPELTRSEISRAIDRLQEMEAKRLEKEKDES